MKREEADRAFAKMRRDMETLVAELGLTEAQAEAATRMSEQLILYASKLRKGHRSGAVKRSVLVELAALGMAAIHRATAYRTSKGK